MTINKSQGQSLKVVGLNLDTPILLLGQLYVGYLRVGNPKKIFHLTPGGKTMSVVHSEALFN